MASLKRFEKLLFFIRSMQKVCQKVACHQFGIWSPSYLLLRSNIEDPYSCLVVSGTIEKCQNYHNCIRTGPGYAGQESEALYQELEPQYQSLDQVRPLHHHRHHHRHHYCHHH